MFPCCEGMGGVKWCNYNHALLHSVHYSEPSHSHSKPAFIDSAQREVFMKTLGFFCALMQNGCPFDPEHESELENEFEYLNLQDSNELENPMLFYERLYDVRFYKDSSTFPKCTGKLIFRKNEFGQPFIQ